MMDSSKYLKQKITYGNIDAEFDELALEVHYIVEASTLNDYGETVHTKKKENKQTIRLKDFGENTNIPLYAQNIVEHCEFIHETQMPQVIDRLYALQAHIVTSGNRADSAKQMEREARRRRKLERKRREREAAKAEERKKIEAEVASMEKVEDYLEGLCDEDMKLKLQGTAMLLQLSRDITNLGALVQNDALMSALSRVLKEDYKKSSDLALNIMQIFFNFSVFEEMHEMLMNSKVGNLTMKVVDLESKRHQARMAELERLKQLYDAQQRGDKEAEARIRGEDSKTSERAERKARKAGKRVKKSTKPLPEVVDINRETARMKKLMRKQESLLYVCFCMLLNLAADEGVKRKMVNKGIVKYLVPLLDRPNPKLLLLVTNFLRALPQCVAEIGELGAVSKLANYVPCNLPELLFSVLKLLFNLSFDAGNREKMVEQGLLRKLVALLKQTQLRAITIQLLYHISMHDRAKSEFTYTEAVPLVMQLIIHFPAPVLAKELIALGINLSLNGRNARLMAQGDGLKLLMQRLMKTHDPLLMKMIRNISQWSHSLQANLPLDGEYSEEGLWAPFVTSLFKICAHTRVTPELQLEVLATLANLTTRDLPPDMTFADLLARYGFVPLLYKLMVPGFAEDDMILQVIMLVGVIAGEANSIPLLVGGNVIQMVDSVMQEPSRGGDPEFVLQSLFTYFRLLHHKPSAEVVVYDTQAVNMMCSCLDSEHPDIAAIADECLDYVMDFDTQSGSGQIASRVKELRYKRHNHQWLVLVHSELNEEEETKRWMHGDLDEASQSEASYSESGQWNSNHEVHMNHEAVAMDLGMLGYSYGSDGVGESGEQSGLWGAGGGMVGRSGSPGQWAAEGAQASPGSGGSWEGEHGY